MSQGNAFDFLDRPARGRKPRARGVTVASDWGFSLTEAESIIEVAGDVIDHMKMPDHVGLMWRWDADWIRRKTAYYDSVGIHALPGGIPFEVAAVQGKVPQFMERVAALGFKAVEVSTDSIDLPLADRAASIEWGLQHGLEVFTELGKKLPDDPLDPAEAAEMARFDLDAGAYMVVLEKADVAIAIERGRDTIHKVMEAIGPDKLIVECGPGADWTDIAKWLIREFGPEVNLENIDAKDAAVVEAMRHGLSRGIDYEYFHPYRGKALPTVDGP